MFVRSNALSNRRGTSLMEVLVSILIMGIGVTSVIALFPIGVERVRQAVLDTRCTIEALNAKEVTELKQIPNDPLLWRWDQYEANEDIFDTAAFNKYAFLWDPSPTVALTVDDLYLSGQMGQCPDTGGALLTYTPDDPANEFKSFPILVDPWLYASGWQNLPIMTYYGGAGTPYYDIRVESIAEAEGTGAPAITPIPAAEKTAFLTRWFSSAADIHYDTVNPVLPMNPAGTGAPPTGYIQLDATTPSPTAARTYPYTWALMLQPTLGAEAGTAAPPVAHPDLASGVTQPPRILCFYKRDMTEPVTVIEGCFFNGSTKVTLSWPATKPRPAIKRGTWLMEASITRDGATGSNSDAGNRNSGLYSGAGGPLWHYRRGYEFYRVVDFSDPQVIGTRIYQEVQVHQAPRDLPVTHSLGDLRPPDTYVAPAWPLVDTTPLTPLNEVDFPVVYYPVVIFNGLQEVF